MRNPSNEVTKVCYEAAKEVTENVYIDVKPKEDNYPFIHIAEQYYEEMQTKTHLYGYVDQVINIYSHDRGRMEVIDLENKFLYKVKQKLHTDNFYVIIDKVNARTLIEEYEEQRLFRRMIDLRFKIN